MDSCVTNDRLFIPPGAINKYEKYRVCYRCDTFFENYDDLLPGNKFLSGIVDFHLHTAQLPFNFQSAVCISVYHTPLNKDEEKSMVVLCISDTNEVTEIKPCPAQLLMTDRNWSTNKEWQLPVNDQLPFYINCGDHVDIYSNHFSRYVCCQTGHGEQGYPSDMLADVFLTADIACSASDTQLLLKVSMATHNNLSQLPSVREVFTKQFATKNYYSFCMSLY